MHAVIVNYPTVHKLCSWKDENKEKRARAWHGPFVKIGTPYATLRQDAICGQSYKAPTIVIYNSRVVPDLKLPHFTTLES